MEACTWSLYLSVGAALASPASATEGPPKWVLTLSEEHHTIYRRALGDDWELFIENSQGEKVGRLLLSEKDRQRWRRSLAEWHAPSELRLDPTVAARMDSFPAPYAASLLRSVPAALAAPDEIFYGLRGEAHDDGGYAYCRRMSHMYVDRDQHISVRGKRLVFCVYANSDGVVFDWAWVRASAVNPKRPVRAAQRFVSSLAQPTSARLQVLAASAASTEPWQPASWHAEAGDCLVMQYYPAPYVAEWINHDLTVFRSWPVGQLVGLKVKNVQRHLRRIRESGDIKLDGASGGLSVSALVQVAAPSEARVRTTREGQQFVQVRDLKPAIPDQDWMVPPYLLTADDDLRRSA